MSVLDELQKSIENGHPGETEKLIQEALKEQISSEQLIEEVMMPAMQTVGEQYKEQDADIVSILAAARCVRKALERIEDSGAYKEEEPLGTVILGTVEGDLHDVGKTLVAVMFRSAGFKVIDLGVDISEKQFLKAVRETPDVNIVCISSLMSTTIPEMRQVVKTLRKNDPEKKYKIMVGGGAVTKELAENMGADAYTDNCVEAAEVAKTFIV